MKSSKINSANQKLNEYDVTIDTGRMCQMFDILEYDLTNFIFGKLFDDQCQLIISRHDGRFNRILVREVTDISRGTSEQQNPCTVLLERFNIVYISNSTIIWNNFNVIIFYNFSEVLFSGKIPCHEHNTITPSMLENNFLGILENLNENKQDIHSRDSI